MTKKISKARRGLNKATSAKKRKSKKADNTASKSSINNQAPVTNGIEEKKKTYIVRIMGKGQFQISATTVKKLNELDNSIVKLIRKTDEQELKKRLEEMILLVTKEHRPLDVKEIMPSDFIIPNTNLSIKEANEWFEGEGLIPEDI